MTLLRRDFLSAIALLPFTAAAPGAQVQPGEVRVRLVTTSGAITLALDARRAPMTVANFMRYVDDGRLDGTEFYRAARRQDAPHLGFIQGGIATDARRMLPALKLEPARRTGLRHLDGSISMAHGADRDSANGNFSIMVGANPGLDGGYAAFGRVVAGMDVVRRILAMPSGGGRGPMRGQMLVSPVRILRAERLTGTPQPTGRPKPWLLTMPWHKK